VQVKLEDIAATEEIFTTLMGEDVESRRKFIEENALDVKEPGYLGLICPSRFFYSKFFIRGGLAYREHIG
jgi:hypothetical protein